MSLHYDEETDINTIHFLSIEGIRVELNDSWCPGATISLYQRSGREWDERMLLCTNIDCPKQLLWMPPAFTYLGNGIEIEYSADGYMRQEMFATDEEVDEIASRAEYDGEDVAHIAVACTLSIGTSTTWIRVDRYGEYSSFFDVDVRFCVEFENSEECTRFIDEDMAELRHRHIYEGNDVGVVDDIIRALSPMSRYHESEKNAVRRRVPYSQFMDECPQPETQVIRRRGSNSGDDRPCFLTLDLSIEHLFYICRVDWSATTVPSTFPSRSGTFQSLNNVHVNFPVPTPEDRDHNSQEDLTITISAGEISFSTGTCSVSPGKGSTLGSKHQCTININNYNNKIMGDAFFGTINGGNVGGRNNVNTIRISSPVGSRSPRILCPLPRRPAAPHQRQIDSQAGVGRWVQPRPLRHRPY